MEFGVGGGYLRTELPGTDQVDAWTLGGSYRYWSLVRECRLWPEQGEIEVLLAILPGRRPCWSIVESVGRPSYCRMRTGLGQTNGGFQSGDADKRQLIKVGFGYQLTPQLNLGMHYFRGKQSGSTVSGNFNSTANFLVAAAGLRLQQAHRCLFGD